VIAQKTMDLDQAPDQTLDHKPDKDIQVTTDQDQTLDLALDHKLNVRTKMD